MISPDGGRGWFYLPPIEAPSGMIPLYEDWAKKPHVVIPDTLIDGESKAYLVSSNVKLKIKAYGSAFNGQTECCFSIMEKVNVSCVVPYNENNNDPKPFPVEKETGTGCGNGVGLSLLLPLLLTIPGKKSIQQNILHKKRK